MERGDVCGRSGWGYGMDDQVWKADSVEGVEGAG